MSALTRYQWNTDLILFYFLFIGMQVLGNFKTNKQIKYTHINLFSLHASDYPSVDQWGHACLRLTTPGLNQQMLRIVSSIKVIESTRSPTICQKWS